MGDVLPDTDQLDWDTERHEVMRRVSDELDEWAGFPMPLTSHRLVLEDRYPIEGVAELANRLYDTRNGPPSATGGDDLGGWTGTHVCRRGPIWMERNSWVDAYRGRRVAIDEDIDGEVDYVGDGVPRLKLRTRLRARVEPLDDPLTRVAMTVRSVTATPAWDPEAERTAMRKLRELLPDDEWDQYELTGGFLERSKRSPVTYLFRRLRPTIAMVENGSHNSRVLAVLCMHPTGFYDHSYAGVMCPTDDVIAHLVTMRGDEHYLWRKANQHSMWAPEAGL